MNINFSSAVVFYPSLQVFLPKISPAGATRHAILSGLPDVQIKANDVTVKVIIGIDTSQISCELTCISAKPVALHNRKLI